MSTDQLCQVYFTGYCVLNDLVVLLCESKRGRNVIQCPGCSPPTVTVNSGLSIVSSACISSYLRA